MIIRALKQVSPAKQSLQRLTDLIESGQLQASSLLPSERHLAHKLGVSRGVVREVTKKLEQQGLVDIRQGVGVQVINNPSLPVQRTFSVLVPKNIELLRQCAQARMLLEPEMAAGAALRCTPAGIRRLKALHKAFLAEREIEKIARKDLEFHDAIARMAGNRVLAIMLQSVAELGFLSRRHALRRVGSMQAQHHHARILTAIAARNPEAARRAMKNHLVAALGDLS